MSDIEHRIKALEKVNRRWRYATVSLAGILLIALVCAAKLRDEVPDLLQARRIQVLGPDGKPAIVLNAGTDGTYLRLTAQGKEHQRAIALGAHEEGVRLMLMKHKEAPLLIAEVKDDGSSLTLFDGREPTQRPGSISLGAKGPTEAGAGGTAIMLNKGMREELRAGLFMMEPTETTENSYLFLDGPKRTATGRVNQENGKLEFVDKNNKAMWSTP
ncbi:MAG: hypothetical protein JSU94_08000 [Phycisphaerales bacterium]|nr:MAG: hypothetical protein JSU94_08000 [Phycisphaerales bacterium]